MLETLPTPSDYPIGYKIKIPYMIQPQSCINTSEGPHIIEARIGVRVWTNAPGRRWVLDKPSKD